MPLLLSVCNPHFKYVSGIHCVPTIILALDYSSKETSYPQGIARSSEAETASSAVQSSKYHDKSWCKVVREYIGELLMSLEDIEEGFPKEIGFKLN